MTTRARAGVAATILAVGTLLLPVYGTSAAAAPGQLHSPEVCPHQTSGAATWTITNNLAVPIRMHVVPGSWRCAKWSGTSNPSAYNDLVVWPGSPRALRLEPSGDGALWTEEFRTADGGLVASLELRLDARRGSGRYAFQMFNGREFARHVTVPLNAIGPGAGAFATLADDHGHVTFHN